MAEKIANEKLAVGWPWRFFVFSLLVGLASIVIYLGLGFGYKNYLQIRIEQYDEDIKQLSEAIPQAQQERLTNFYSQLANLQNILNKHVFVSNIFPMLERNTNQLIYFKLADFKLSDRRLVLEGTAASYQVLSQQLEAFDRSPEIERVMLNESHLESGGISFRLFLVLNENVFRK